MEEENQTLFLIEETQIVLNDIFLSGFHSVANSSIEKIEQLEKLFSQYGMHTGEKLLTELKKELMNRQGSFQYQLDNLTKAFCFLEFYLTNAKVTLE